MKKLAFLLFALAAPAFGQTSFPYIVPAASDITGNACVPTNQLKIYHSGNDLFLCGSGNVYVKVTASSSGGTVTGGTCTNQVTTAISTAGVPTCTTVTSAYVDSSVITKSSLPDVVNCPLHTFSTTSPEDVCDLTIPANRVPFSGVYRIDVSCVAVATTTTPTFTFNPEFFDSASSTNFSLTNGTMAATTALNNGHNGYITLTGFGLVAPASGTGFTQAGGIGSYMRDNGVNITMLGVSSQSVSTAALVSSSGSNKISIFVTASTQPNSMTCTITGTLAH